MKKSVIFLLLLLAVSVLAVFMPAVNGPIVTEGINSGDVAWMLAASALVLLMTPVMAYFHGGTIDSTNLLSITLQTFIPLGRSPIVWIDVCFSLPFLTPEGE